ncbi:MAG: threonine--tRNA ligase [Alphaproteobacteria bacterium]|nr:threonine--tRNA ligase [Alphaproteobacteria bacterium]
MVALTLPDGSVRSFPGAVTGTELAAAIGPGLAKAALFLKLDGQVVDLATRIERDAKVAIVTARDDAVLELLRHDCAHVLAEAVKELYNDVQVTIGPSIEDGFYYDFARRTPFTPEDLVRIEIRMHEIVDRNEPIRREEWERGRAIEFFKAQGEHYKAEIVAAIPEGEPIGVYSQGRFTDLCRGPHLASTGRLGHAFKLTKLAGAYWRGDSRNEMLQRVYGTCWRDDKELQAYLTRIEEAEKRDHRRLGRELELFHQQEEAPGMVFWHPRGWTLWRMVEAYMRRRLETDGYVEVKTPQLVDRAFWQQSGHWEHFRDKMFVSEIEERTFALKPMNCPGAVQIFKRGVKSYRDLPLRLAEFGACHRYEPSGALHGLMRVRGFVQDDAHLFCAEDQITAESIRFCDLLTSIYGDFGFADVTIKFADRPAVRAGSDAIWDKAEQALKDAAKAAGLNTILNPGEGAFYGPKLEFVLRDAIGRDWQCGTLQVDFVLPERLDAEYTAEDGSRRRPVMLHRVILGSFERFLAILIEDCAGKFPLWLAPTQLVAASIVSDANDYAAKVVAEAAKLGLRAELDARNDKINFKVREHSLRKIPAILAIGKREAEQGTVSVRRLGSETSQVKPLAAALAELAAEALPPDQRR